MATGAVQFQNFLSNFEDQMTQLLQEIETWAGNKADANPNFDFTSAQTALATAQTNLQTSATALLAT